MERRRITLARSVFPQVAGYGKKGLAFSLRIGAFDDAALAGHDGLAGPEMAPAGGDGEVVAGHVAVVSGGGHGDGGDLGAERAGGDAGNGRVGVQQGGQLAPAGGGDGQGLGGLLGMFGRRGGSRTALAAMERVACRISRTAGGIGRFAKRPYQRSPLPEASDADSSGQPGSGMRGHSMRSAPALAWR